MPTFTAIALENLFETRPLDSLQKLESEENGRPRHLYISPALYTTPEQAPISEFSLPGSLSPSPYVANHKRRGGGHAVVPEPHRLGNETEGFGEEEELENIFSDEVDGVGEAEDEGEGSFDPMSELDAADLSQMQVESRSFVSAQGEFFDAIDEFSSDGSISNTPSREYRLSEFHASRLNVLEEIGKRKTAEEALLSMCSQWEKIRILMSEAGLNFPAPPAIGDSMQFDDQMLDKISQEVVVARFVAEAVGRGMVRAEAEEAASAVIELKDQEILRLRDRLQYYEMVNHEMSQRKLVEVARRQQERKRRRRWLWSILGMGVSICASLAAYSYISHTSECVPLLESSSAADIAPPETSQVS